MVERLPEIGKQGIDRSEGFGERLLGTLLDRAHEMPPQLIAPLVAEEVGVIGGRDVSIMVQDYSQEVLVPLPGRGLAAARPERMNGTPAGQAFDHATIVEQPGNSGVRVFLPLLDGSDIIGVLGITFDEVDDDDRRLLSRLAGLVADTLVTKSAYTDQFFQARRREPMSVAAEIQWSQVPPMTMVNPQVAVAGSLQPPYDIAGDSFDYAINDNILHVAVIDAMGHGLEAAAMATIAIGALRHARRGDIGLAETYAYLDAAISELFAPDRFVTAQMVRMDIHTGILQWVNAGHPAPLLIRDRRVVQELEGPTTLPVGFGGDQPQVSAHDLQRGDRVLFFTDGVFERGGGGGAPLPEDRLIGFVESAERTTTTVQEAVRSLSEIIRKAHGGRTSDDATLLLVEWRGNSTHHLAEGVGQAQAAGM